MEKARGKGRADVAFNLGALYADQGDVCRARELFEEAHGVRKEGHVLPANCSLGEPGEKQSLRWHHHCTSAMPS